MCKIIKEEKGLFGIFNKRTCVAVLKVSDIAEFMKSVSFDSKDKYFVEKV